MPAEPTLNTHPKYRCSFSVRIFMHIQRTYVQEAVNCKIQD